MNKSTKWGTTSSKVRHKDVDGWRIETEKFTCTDGEEFYRVKKARNDYSFDDPTASIYGWESSITRKRTEFQTREDSLAWVLSTIKID